MLRAFEGERGYRDEHEHAGASAGTCPPHWCSTAPQLLPIDQTNQQPSNSPLPHPPFLTCHPPIAAVSQAPVIKSMKTADAPKVVLIFPVFSRKGWVGGHWAA